MEVLAELRPKQKLRVIDLVQQAGVSVDHWKNYRGTHPSANPKYCYNWSFEQPGELVVVCLWHADLIGADNMISFHRDGDLPNRAGAGASVWRRREGEFSARLELAYRQGLPVRVILLEGVRHDLERGKTKASKVNARRLDPVPWAVVDFNSTSGEFELVRGKVPTGDVREAADFELAWFEGEARRQFIFHRRREGQARKAKIDSALKLNDGRLVCEVPGCGFDFVQRYGSLGEGYAHVHHLIPLKYAPKEGRKLRLADLVIVCPNCHAMIHLGGECRSLKDLIRVS